MGEATCKIASAISKEKKHKSGKSMKIYHETLNSDIQIID